MKSRKSVFILVALLIATLPVAAQTAKVKNVIVLIPDGMSTGGLTLSRWYSGGAPLALDSMASGLVRTYSADSPIADSAPAATAYATGFKAQTGNIGVLPAKAGMWGVDFSSENVYKPVANILEAARLSGRATGLIATCEIPHATPAAFSAHDPSRKNYDDILEQQIFNGIDVVFAGGFQYLGVDVRKDKENLIDELTKMKYQFIQSGNDFTKLQATKVWGLFAPVALAYDIDRKGKDQPSLSEMTNKAIEILSKDKDGFFLMVEGSKIDWAAHANDPVGIVSDILSFDAAVKVALDFATKDKNTIVIALTDHGNSGITIGNSATNSTYDKTPLSTYIDPIKKAKLSGEGLSELFNKDFSNIKEVMADSYGIVDLTEDEINAIKNTALSSMSYTVGPMLAKRANIGFTTTGHTGEDVVLYTWAPTQAQRLFGTVQNTDIAKYTASSLGLDLAATTKRLYVDANTAFKSKGAEVVIDKSVAANPFLIVKKGTTTLVFPRNRNYVLVNPVIEEKDNKRTFSGGTKTDLEGVSVYISEKETWYIGEKAIQMIK